MNFSEEKTGVWLSSTSPPDRVLGELRDKCISLAERYAPVMFTIPVDVGFRWLPQWSSSPVRSVTSGKSRKLWTPLHRMEWDIFSLCVWDRAMPRMV